MKQRQNIKSLYISGIPCFTLFLMNGHLIGKLYRLIFYILVRPLSLTIMSRKIHNITYRLIVNF